MYEDYCKKKLRTLNTYFTRDDLPKAMRDRLREFDQALSTNPPTKTRTPLTPPTRESYIRHAFFFSKYIYDKTGKIEYLPEKEGTNEKDIQGYLDSIVQNKKKKYSSSHFNWAKLTIKIFYRWLYKMDAGYPNVVAWIKVGKDKPKKLTNDDLLSAAEFRKILNHCESQRDRAFFFMGYDSGARRGELLNLKIGDIRFLDGGKRAEATVCINHKGKTEGAKRALLFFESVPDIKSWINMHPQKHLKDVNDCWLFTTIKKGGEIKPWGDEASLQHFKRIAERAGIKKRIWIHQLRHTSATKDFRKDMPLQLMNMKYGWSPNSRMSMRYTHPNEADLLKFEKRTRGTLNTVEEKVEEEKQIKLLKPIICSNPDCNEINSAVAIRCRKCCTPLSYNAVVEDEKELKNTLSEFVKIARIIDRDPELKKRVLETLSKK